MLGIKSYLKKFYRRNIYYPYIWQSELDNRAKSLSGKNEIVIAFIVINIPMWKYQPLYDLLKKNKRFKLYIVLSPSVKYSFEERCRDAQLMRKYFSERGMEFIDWDIEHQGDPVDIKKEINPDILFYTQPGIHVFTKLHSFRHFKDKLLCYTFYGFITTDNKHFYDREFLNIAWKLYYPMETQRKLARKYAERKGDDLVLMHDVSFDSPSGAAQFCIGGSVNGWKEGSTEALIPFLESYVKEGVKLVLCTDISKDGMLQGAAVQLYKDIMTQFPTLKLIASGGVSSMKDIEELDKAGIYAVVTGKAIYENKITLEEITHYIKTHKN